MALRVQKCRRAIRPTPCTNRSIRRSRSTRADAPPSGVPGYPEASRTYPKASRPSRSACPRRQRPRSRRRRIPLITAHTGSSRIPAPTPGRGRRAMPLAPPSPIAPPCRQAQAPHRPAAPARTPPACRPPRAPPCQRPDLNPRALLLPELSRLLMPRCNRTEPRRRIAWVRSCPTATLGRRSLRSRQKARRSTEAAWYGPAAAAARSAGHRRWSQACSTAAASGHGTHNCDDSGPGLRWPR
jgi:hypothetical protein